MAVPLVLNKRLCSPGIVAVCWSSPSCWLCSFQFCQTITSDAALAWVWLNPAWKVLRHCVKVFSHLFYTVYWVSIFLLPRWSCMLGEKRNRNYFRNLFTNPVSHPFRFAIVTSMNSNHDIHFSLTYHSSSTYVWFILLALLTVKSFWHLKK